MLCVSFTYFLNIFLTLNCLVENCYTDKLALLGLVEVVAVIVAAIVIEEVLVKW